MASDTITPAKLNELLRSGQPVQVIDVRTPAEFREVHLDCARNMPLDELDAAALLKTRQQAPGGRLYVVCRSGNRSRQACEQLAQAGHKDVVSVEGGTLACVDAGLPVARGKRAVSLERQVRIAAGSLVLLGVALGWFVHPWAFGLSAFVGAGLVFAGITDTCGMGLLLARMPWNKRAS